jgi:hypothetical protein
MTRRRGAPRRAAQRGVIFTEYLIITFVVMFVFAGAIYSIGPKLVDHHRVVVREVIQEAP